MTKNHNRTLGRDIHGATGVNYTNLKTVQKIRPVTPGIIQKRSLNASVFICGPVRLDAIMVVQFVVRLVMSVISWIVILILWFLFSAAAVVGSLFVTNPASIGPAGVTAWFVLLLSALVAGFTLILYAAKSFLRVHATGANRLRYSRRQGLLLAAWITVLLGLASLHQLGVLDAILLGLLLVIVEVYVRFRWP